LTSRKGGIVSWLRVDAGGEALALVFAVEDDDLRLAMEFEETFAKATTRPPESVDDDPSLGMGFGDLDRHAADLQNLRGGLLPIAARSTVTTIFDTAHRSASRQVEEQKRISSRLMVFTEVFES
jgi:hypothetical protein